MLFSIRCLSADQVATFARRLGVFVVPILTGTSIDGAQFKSTQYGMREIALQPLSFEAMWAIVNETINCDGKLTKILEDQYFRTTIADLGGNSVFFCLQVVH